MANTNNSILYAVWVNGEREEQFSTREHAVKYIERYQDLFPNDATITIVKEETVYYGTKDRHIRQGCCPRCAGKSPVVNYEIPEIDWRGNLTIAVQCHYCDRIWKETYKITGVIHDEPKCKRNH